MNSDDPIAILKQAIALLQRTETLLDEVNAKLDHLVAPSVTPEWVDKHDAAKIVCKHWKTLDRWRSAQDSTLIEGLHWQHDGGEIVYHAELLKDWYRHRGDPETHLKTIANFTAKLPSNQPKKRAHRAS
jgi:hypothetical protein